MCCIITLLCSLLTLGLLSLDIRNCSAVGGCFLLGVSLASVGRRVGSRLLQAEESLGVTSSSFLQISRKGSSFSPPGCAPAFCPSGVTSSSLTSLLLPSSLSSPDVSALNAVSAPCACLTLHVTAAISCHFSNHLCVGCSKDPCSS